MSNNLMKSSSLFLLMLVFAQFFYGASRPRVVVLDTGRELQLAFDTGRASGTPHHASYTRPQSTSENRPMTAKPDAIWQQQEKRSDDFQERRSNSNPHIWAPAAASSSAVPSTLHRYWDSFKSEAPAKFYRFVVVFKESGKWFLSFTAPVALAMGHGLLNNFLAHKTGQLRQEPFFVAPWYEIPIGLSALALHALLGKNLYQKLYDKLYRNPYRDHSEGAATFAVVYLLISGSLQNVGERLPMHGTGWRLPIFGSHQTFFDAILSNISLYAAMHGVFIGGVIVLGMIPDWLERGSYG